MQQVSEPIESTDAAPADVITSPDGAAHACSNCEALMVLRDDPEDSEPMMVCPECNLTTSLALLNARASTPEPDARSMRCETCGLQVLVEPLPSGHGFKLLAIERDVAGVDHTSAFGVSPNGFPICPKDGVALLPLGPVPVGEAFAGVKDALQDTEGPVQPRLPGTTPPFDVEKAYRAEHRLREQVREAEADYEDKAGIAKEAKKELERVQELLGKLMDEHERREREARYEDQRGTLRPEQHSVCAYERQTGQPCHVCREARKRVKEDESHDEGDLRIASLQEHLARRGVHLVALELMQFAEDDKGLSELAALEAFAHDEKAKLPPFVVARSCSAGPASEGGQHCTTCGALLAPSQADGTPYPEGDRVGLDCAGDPNAPAVDEDASPEPARQPRRRHKDPKDASAAKSKAGRGTEPKAEKKATRKKRARA